MVGTSKILTVSYGTFSCTLEGFEDSFSTMKAIAEYFRDLAADDRYFGAEPATPDAEMLARIAEREIARRVEARTDASGIVLRAGQALPKAEAPAAPPAPPAQSSPTAAEVPAAEARDAASAEAGPGSETEAQASTLLAVSEPEAAAGDDIPAAARMDEDVDVDAEAAVDMDADVDPDEDDDSDDDDATARRVAPAPRSDDDIFVETVTSAAPTSEATMPPAARRPTPREVIVPTATATAPQAASPAKVSAPSDDGALLAAVSSAARTATATPPRAKASEVSAPAPGATIPAHPDADSVAAKLQRIRAVVGRTAPQGTEADPTDEDEAAPAPATVAAMAATLAQTAPDRNDAPVAQPEAEAEAEAEDAAAAEPAAPVAATAAAAAQPGPVRARVIKMRRADFDKAVSRGLLRAEEAEADPDTADLAAEAVEDDPDAEPKSAIGLDWDDDDQADLTAEAADADDVDDADDADQMWTPAAEVPSDAELAARLEQAADAALTAEDEDDQDDLARMDGVSADEPAAWDLSDEDEADLLAELAEVEREMGLSEPETDADAADDTNATLDDARDEEAEAALDPAEAQSGVEADASDLDEADSAEAAWADEAEEAEVAHEADLDTSDPAEDAVAATADAEAEPDVEDAAGAEVAPAAALRPRRVQMPQGPDEDEDAVSRLLSRTDAQLSEPEANRRRDAITQLKAAVAAKEADGSLVKPDEDKGIETAFRDDLRQVVRPRRPLTAEARTERPRAAPLKLVQSQRVDLPRDAAPAARAPIVPVRPRRVSVEEAAPAGRGPVSGGSFAAFAQDMGAHSLGDLLEAAAAYTAFVEGSEDFSRPQILNKVRESRDDISREDGLRSFGTLLREGRIMKVRNGRFAVSEETRFHPERRAG